MSRKYCYIYQSLVTGEDDIFGQFAYNAYKADKIKFIESYKSTHKGKLPSDSELDQFHNDSLAWIPEYKRKGEEVAEKMIEILVNDQIIDIQNDCMSQIENSLNAALDKQPKQLRGVKAFFTSVASSCVGALIVALIPFLLAWICYLFNPDATREYLEEVFHFNKEKTELVDVNNQ